MTNDENVSDAEKAQIAANLAQQAPPGEFNEVWNDVRVLLNDDNLMQNAEIAAANYHKGQFLPVKYDIDLPKTLLTIYNQLPNGRFYDPVTKKSFAFNFLSKAVSDIQPHDAHINDKVEAFRKAIQQELDAYVREHYHNSGTGVVFVHNNQLIIAIESHLFQPKNYWNGRWRSTWEVPSKDKHETVEVAGNCRINVHYFEDGNVQLSTKKDMKASVKFTGDHPESAKNLVQAILKSETEFEVGYRNLTPSIPAWRLSASRSSGSVSFPQFDRDSFAPRQSRFGSAHYAAVPPSTNARLASQQRDAFVADTNAQQEWERQFFDDDGISTERVDFVPPSHR